MNALIALGIVMVWLLLGLLALFVINRIDNDPNVEVGEDLVCVLCGPISLILMMFFVIDVLNKRAKNRDVGNFYRVITGRKKKKDDTRSLY